MAEMKENRSRKKLKLEDITYYSNKKQHPFSYSRSPTPKHTYDPQMGTRASPLKNIYNSSVSPMNCCARNRGIMRQAIAARIQQYKRDCKRKALRKTIQEAREETRENELRQLREAPLINEESKKLFQKVAEKRNLSPKVLVRFEQYERSKTIHKLTLRIEKYLKERKKMPRPQEVVSPGKLAEAEQASKLIRTLSESLNRFVIRPQKIEIELTDQ